MSRLVKQLMTDEYADRFRSIRSCVFVRFEGMDAEETHALRGDLRAQEPPVEMQVVKNSLAARAFEDLGLEDVQQCLDGPTAVVHGGPGAVEMTKVITRWSNQGQGLDIKGGFLEGRGAIDPTKVRALSEIPDRDTLLAQVASGLGGPLRGLAGSLQGIVRKLAYALQAVKESKEEGE